MNRSPLNIARELLLEWIACDEKRSYDSIRKTCTYLGQTYELGLGDTAVWRLFNPLLRAGVVDFCGNDCYAVTEHLAISRNGLYTYTGLPSSDERNRTPYVGFYRTKDRKDIEGIKEISFDALSVLHKMPSVEQVVDSFPKSVVDLEDADYCHYKGKKGLTRRYKDGNVRYFCIPEKLYQREVPGRNINPDAFDIAYSYSRAVNGEGAGIYHTSDKRLTMQAFGLPIMIERILFLESITKGLDPIKSDYTIDFPGITKDVARELNRILCKTIRYE